MKELKMKTPDYLTGGDRVAVVAPARSVTVGQVEPFIRILAGWGLDVVTGPHLYSVYHQFAGTDNERASDFQMMLDDPSVKAIFCARGGYGTVRIIDRLDFTAFALQPKWITGFSDVTVFHSHIHRHCGIETLHATMPYSLTQGAIDPASFESLRKALFGSELSYEVDAHTLNRQGQGQGMITGGNLSMLYSLTGTPSDIDTHGKILVIEDVDEYLYHIDRMMMNLKRSGKLDHLSGLVVGGMTGMNDNIVPFGKTAYHIIAEVVASFRYPVCYGFPCGHTPKNLALVFGRQVTLDVGEKVHLLFHSGE
jgi:muramoyltetrapeptide carboxypeptidase